MKLRNSIYQDQSQPKSFEFSQKKVEIYALFCYNKCVRKIQENLGEIFKDSHQFFFGQ